MCKHANHEALLTIDQVPRFLRYNSYIRSGYRHPTESTISTARHVIESIFSWHNESINIWSHVLALAVFILLVIYEYFCRDYIRWMVILQCIACFIAFFGSIMYHSTMSKCHCKKDYNCCMNYDVCGIIVSLSLSSLSPIISGYRCNSFVSIVFALITMLCSAYYCAIKVLAPKVTHKIRGKYIAGLAIIRTTLALFMVLPNYMYHGRYESLFWHMFSVVILIIGGAINIGRYPEKLLVNEYVSSFFLVKNGEILSKKMDDDEEKQVLYHEVLDLIRYCIDYIGNSHQIWHVLIMMSSVACYYGCVWDDLYLRTTFCSADHAYNLAQDEIAQMYMSESTHSSGVYVLAMEIKFDPSFLYPF